MEAGMEKQKERESNVFYRSPLKYYPMITKGEGIYLYDDEGNKLIDGSGGPVVVNIGHGVKEVNEAIDKIRLICPWGVGGGSDTASRKMASVLSTIIGANVVVSNVKGGQEVAALSEMLRKPADGYTLCQHTSSLLLHVYGPKARWKIPDDIVPLARLQYAPSTIYKYPKAPWKDAKELLTDIKANPGKVRVATACLGPPDGSFVNAFKKAGYDLKIVVYENPGERYASTIGGHNKLLFEQIGDVIGFIKANQLTPMLHLGDNRSPFMPDVPCTGEFGLKGYEYGEFRSICVKAGIPPDIMKKLKAAVDVLYRTREWKDFSKKYYMDWKTDYLPTEKAIKFYETVAVAFGVK